MPYSREERPVTLINKKGGIMTTEDTRIINRIKKDNEILQDRAKRYLEEIKVYK